MVIAATVIWVIGAIITFIVGMTAMIDLGDIEEVNELIEKWGVVRVLTLWLLIVLIVAPLWPIALVTVWIVALIKGW